MSQTQQSEKSSIGIEVKDMPERPNLYDVVFLNDDYTPVNFVVFVLTNVFKHSEKDANDLAYEIHNQGSSVVGTFIKEIAKQKSNKTLLIAEKNGFPLTCRVQINSEKD